MNVFVDRVMRALRLEAALYEEVEADVSALPQALAVVVLSSLAAGIGSLRFGLAGLLLGVFAALVGWVLWALVVYLVGVKMLPEPQTKSDIKELLRATGFASAPGLIRVLGAIPYLGGLVVLIASLWMLAAMVIAVRQALDYQSTWRAVGVCLLGWILQAAILAPLLLMFSPAQP